MDQEYDAIVLGTGLKECILSGLLSTDGKKVLHIDRNPYYGGECASLNLEQLYEKFRPGVAPPATMGRAREYCVDLCPKFLMSCGNLVKVLLHTQVTKYLEFKSVAGSFVVQAGKVHKVPSTPSEALSSGLLGIFQKRRFRTFLQFASQYDENDPKTHEGLNLDKMSTKALFEYYKLEDTTQQFTGHAIALQPDESYMERPAKDTIKLIQLYAYSVSRYGNSPYIYPVYGLGGLPEGFSRLCAIHGGTYMTFEDVRVPVENLIGKENEGFKAIMYNFNHERWGFCVQSIRFARVCVEEAMKYAFKRKTFGKKLIEHPVIRFKLAQMARQVEASHAWLEYITFQMKTLNHEQQNVLLGGPIALLKLQSTQTFEFCAREASQIFGGLAYTRGGQGEKVERLYREVRAMAIPAGSEEIMADLGVRQALKHAPNFKGKL